MTINDLHQTLPMDTRPIRAEGLEVEKIPCCWLVWKKGEDRRVKLNESSMLIWQLCSGEVSVGEIIAGLEEQFPEAQGIEKDVQRALDELLAEGLISLC